MTDMVNKPPHYNESEIECIDAIEASMTKEAFENGSDWLVIGRPITKGNIKKNIQKLIEHLNK